MNHKKAEAMGKKQWTMYQKKKEAETKESWGIKIWEDQWMPTSVGGQMTRLPKMLLDH